MKKDNIRVLLKQVWGLTKSYWRSEEKVKAFTLLFTIIGLTLSIVYVQVEFNNWYKVYWAALQKYETDTIYYEMKHFTVLAFIYISLNVISYYFQQRLILNWRRWLTNRYIEQWLRHKTYYRLQMFGVDTDNPDQRISEDVNLFVGNTLSYSIGLLNAVTTLVSFVAILWGLSGPLDFTVFGHKLHVEGYLVWAAVAYSVLGTYVTHKVGHSLVKKNFIQQRYEADFRYSMMRMRENAESIAFYSGEKHEEKVFKNRFTLLLNNFWSIVEKRKQLSIVNNTYNQLAIIFPMVISVPRYLAKSINIGGVMQISSAFGRVQGALSYFADFYSGLAQWQAVVDRLTEFDEHMKLVEADTPQRMVERKATADDSITLENLNINIPNGDPIIKGLNLTLEPGKNVIVKGTSGSGKSTLLRTLAGIWPYAEGEIIMPPREEVMFIPQRPYLPLGTLRDSVLYPGTRTQTDEELKELMQQCKIGYLTKYLDEEADWSQVFSVGEQQRLAFVRALIYTPKWLFMDESTSALDEATEAAMYTLVAQKLLKTTVVSVGHRSTLNRFHELVLFLDKETKTAELQKQE